MESYLERRDSMEKLQTEHGIFTNNEVTGQTAEEVYQEWLNNKDKPPQPTKEELLEQRINDLELYILTQEGLI